MEAVAVGIKVFSAFEQRKQARREAKMIQLQGEFNKIQTERKAIEKQEQALALLRRQKQYNSAVISRAASGGVDAFSGSALNTRIANKTEIGKDYQKLLNQAFTLERSAGFQQATALATAEQTKRAGYLQALGNLGEAAYFGSQMTTSTT